MEVTYKPLYKHFQYKNTYEFRYKIRKFYVRPYISSYTKKYNSYIRKPYIRLI
jgi:hypothetical protein